MFREPGLTAAWKVIANGTEDKVIDRMPTISILSSRLKNLVAEGIMIDMRGRISMDYNTCHLIEALEVCKIYLTPKGDFFDEGTFCIPARS